MHQKPICGGGVLWSGLRPHACAVPRPSRRALTDMGISGLVPPIFEALINLQSLDLSGNNFTGSIPGAISLLPKLRILDLTGSSMDLKVGKTVDWNTIGKYLGITLGFVAVLGLGNTLSTIRLNRWRIRHILLEPGRGGIISGAHHMETEMYDYPLEEEGEEIKGIQLKLHGTAQQPRGGTRAAAAAALAPEMVGAIAMAPAAEGGSKYAKFSFGATMAAFWLAIDSALHDGSDNYLDDGSPRTGKARSSFFFVRSCDGVEAPWHFAPLSMSANAREAPPAVHLLELMCRGSPVEPLLLRCATRAPA